MSRSSPPARNSIGPHTGVGAFFGGIGFVLGTPSVWPYACVPVLMVLLLTCGLSVTGFHYAGQSAQAITDSVWGQWGLTILFGLLGLAASALAALLLAQPLSGFALEAIAHRQEFGLTGRHPPEPGFFTSVWIGLRCSLFALVVGGSITAMLFIITFSFPPAAVVTVPLKFLVIGWFLAWDLIDYPLGLHGLGISRRLGWVMRHFSAFTTFGLCWAAVLLVPGIGLLVLPLGVAGATRLVVAAEESSQ